MGADEGGAPFEEMGVGRVYIIDVVDLAYCS